MSDLGAATATQANAIATNHGWQVGDVACLSIINLAALGTLKTLVAEGIGDLLLPHIGNGVAIIEHTVLPSCVSVQTTQVVPQDAGADLAETPEGEDEADDANDFEGGQLPGVLTRANETLSSSQRAANLAKDHLYIGKVVGHAKLDMRYPKQMVMAYGPTDKEPVEVRTGLVMCPVQAQGEQDTALAKSRLVRYGVYGGLHSTPPVVVSKNSVLTAKVAHQTHWRAELPVASTGSARDASRLIRSQTGVEAYKQIIADCLSACAGAKALLVRDHFSFVGDVGVACVDLMANASADLPKLFYSGTEHRALFHEATLIRVRTVARTSPMPRIGYALGVRCVYCGCTGGFLGAYWACIGGTLGIYWRRIVSVLGVSRGCIVLVAY